MAITPKSPTNGSPVSAMEHRGRSPVLVTTRRRIEGIAETRRALTQSPGKRRLARFQESQQRLFVRITIFFSDKGLNDHTIGVPRLLGSIPKWTLNNGTNFVIVEWSGVGIHGGRNCISVTKNHDSDASSNFESPR